MNVHKAISIVISKRKWRNGYLVKLVTKAITDDLFDFSCTDIKTMKDLNEIFLDKKSNDKRKIPQIAVDQYQLRDLLEWCRYGMRR